MAEAQYFARKLAETNLDDVSDLYRIAVQHFKNGDIELALKVLDDKELNSAGVELAQRQRQLADAFLLKGRLLITNLQSSIAGQYFERAMAINATFETTFAYGWFLQQQKELDKALTLYLRCLEIARRDNDAAEIAQAQNNLGIVYKSKSEIEKARPAFEEALRIRKNLGTTDSLSQAAVADTLNNLAAFNHEQNRMSEARMEYEESVAVFKDLDAKDPGVYSPELAHALNNLGNLAL